MPRLFSMLLAFLLGSFSACAMPRTGLGDDDGSGQADGGPCQAGQKQCDGNNLLVCNGGSFVPQTTCPVTQRCDEMLGCIACSPTEQPELCVGDDLHHCNSDGTIGNVVQTCMPGQCQVNHCGDGSNCGDGTNLIYVVDQDYHLLSFDPSGDKNVFSLIGTLSCPAGQALDGSGPATPFSMSVDRSGRAWVLYSSGELFFVSTKDASCTPTSFAPQQKGFDNFGMGFVSDAAGGMTETLFLAGGPYANLNTGSLGTLDAASLTVTKIGALQLGGQDRPELTGTGNAELYGYFPGSGAFVAKIDKTTGKNLQTWTLSKMQGMPQDWAFAQWGGRFYIFVTLNKNNMLTSHVFYLDPVLGTTTEVTPNATYKIVGAGVSTCAPVVIG